MTTNGKGWELQEYHEDDGWYNPFKDKQGEPITYPTKQEADGVLSRLLVWSRVPSRNFRVYEVLEIVH